jgi:hypothetical protein
MPMTRLIGGLRRRAWDARLAAAWVAPGLVPRVHHAGLRARWIVPVVAPLILISQVQRSGGTLLGRLFDDHPECFAHPYELLWGKRPGSALATWPGLQPGMSAAAAYARLDERWIRRFVTEGAYRREGSERHPFVFDAALQASLFAEGYAARTPARPRDVLDLYLTAFFNAWLDCQQMYREPKRFVTAFASGLIADAASRAGFRRDYPDGWLISIVREPVSWFASATSFTRSRPLVASVDDAIARWSASTEAALVEASAYPERTIVVCFEDLVRDPRAVMRRICAATGLTFTPALLEPTYNGRPVRSNSSFASRAGFDAGAIDRTAAVPPGDAARLERAAGPLYEAVRRRFAQP